MEIPARTSAIGLVAVLCAAVACQPDAATLAPEDGKTGEGVCRETSFEGLACDGCGFAPLVESIGEVLCAGSPTGADPVDGNCSFAAADLETGETGSYHGDNPVWAMSTIKFVIVAAALHNGVPPESIAALAEDIFVSSSNVAPARVLDELYRTLAGAATVPATSTRAADSVNDFMHDVVGMSEASTFTRWCQAGERCHVSTNCTGVAAGSCGGVTNVLTANDAVLFLRWVWEEGSPGREELLAWSAPREQDDGRLGLRSCGMETVAIHHKIGSAWDAENSNLIYSDIGIIEVPGRAPIVVAVLDGWRGHRGQEGHLSGALYSYAMTGVADFDLLSPDSDIDSNPDSNPDPDPDSGIAAFCGDMGQVDTCAPVAGDLNRIGLCDGRGFRSCPFGCYSAPLGEDDECLPDPGPACSSVSDIDTCSPRFAATLLRCRNGLGEPEWVRCHSGCEVADFGDDDSCG